MYCLPYRLCYVTSDVRVVVVWCHLLFLGR